MSDIYSTPILTARETARYLQMPESTLDGWLAVKDESALVHAVQPERRGWPRVPFVGVIEAYVLRGLRDIGMTMEEIRAAAALVREEFDDPYALARKRIATDGVKLSVRLADDSLAHGTTRQLAIREVVQDYLRYIDWGKDGTAARLHLRHFSSAADVIIDPRFGWGSPVIADSKVRVSDIVGLWRAGERMATVAEEFGLGIDVVEDVLQHAA